VAIVVSGSVGAAVGEKPIVAGVAMGLVAVALWVLLCRRRPAVAFATVIGIVFFSSHVLALAYSFGAPADLVKYAIIAKDALAWILLLCLAVRPDGEGRTAWPMFLVGAFVAICGLFFIAVTSPAPAQVQFQSVRNAVIPVLALGCVVMLRPDERRRASVICVYMATIAAAYGLVELTLPRSFLTDVIGVGRFWTEVKDQPDFVDVTTGLPFNFSTTAGFPRLTGSFGDPLSAGENLGAALVLAAAYKSSIRRSGLVLTVLPVALILTFTRDGWLLSAVGLGFFAIRRYGAGRTLMVAGLALVALVLAFLFVTPLQNYVNDVLTGNDASTLAHRNAIQDSFQVTFSLLGLGWGTAGAGAFNVYHAAVTTENTYVVFLTQVGWIGFLFLALPFGALSRLAIRGQPFVTAGAAVLAAQAVTGLVSENLLTFNGGFLPFAAAGLVASALTGVARQPAQPEPLRSHRSSSFPRKAAGVAAS
jgi:hypothetical protein